MTRPQLLVLSFSTIASDARVLKQVALFSDRYDLYTCGHGPAPAGVAGHYEIPADHQAWQYDRALLVLRRYSRAYWSNRAISAASEMLPVERFDVVVANDIDSVGLALSLRPKRGVHADLHEFAPRQKLDNLKWRLFVAQFMRWMCRDFLPVAASVTTVAQGIAREYEKEYGITAGVVTNAAPYLELPVGEVGEPVRLVHSGACLRSRGIDIMIDAVQMATRPVTLDLYLTPNDPAYLEELRARAESVPGVTLRDPVPYAELGQTLNLFDIGVHILPPTNFNNKWALPNKLFDYVQARLGVIVGPSPEMARVVTETGIGEVLASFRAESLREAIDALTPDRTREWKEASGRSAEELSSGVQVQVWADAVDALLA